MGDVKWPKICGDVVTLADLPVFHIGRCNGDLLIKLGHDRGHVAYVWKGDDAGALISDMDLASNLAVTDLGPVTLEIKRK